MLKTRTFNMCGQEPRAPKHGRARRAGQGAETQRGSAMSTIYSFWPGDYRPTPNEWALPQVTEATGQLEAALKKLGHQPRRIEGFLTKPHESRNRLGPIDDPQIGLFCHWAYGPHTTEGTV